jgi:hypothetical protein
MNYLIKKWIEALRSGQYKQGNGLLRSEENQFCCLGVLCDVYDPANWNQTKYGPHYNFDGLLPGSIYLMGHLEKLVGSLLMMQLIKMNDNGVTFNEIADKIENHFGV